MRTQVATRGIVLARTDYQEADRILTILTPDHGKVRVMAKGVRKAKSKLAGGIELLSVSELTLLPGKGELWSLISSRLVTHYGRIVKDIQRTMVAYELLKRINRFTEDAADREYFDLLVGAFEGLDDADVPLRAVEMWFVMQLLNVTGHVPNLRTDSEGHPLDATKSYVFDMDGMHFREQPGGPFGANHIKLMRLGYAADNPLVFKQITDAEQSLQTVNTLVQSLGSRITH